MLLKENKQEEVVKEAGSSFSSGSGFKNKWGATVGRRTTPWKKPEYQLLEKEVLETKRVVKVTKGGRRFSFSGLVLVKDPEKKSVAFSFVKSKEMGTILKKAFFKAKKRMISYFPEPTRTISSQILVKYKSTRIFIKPTPKGSGIKAGGVLNVFFKYLDIKDVSAKIMGSRNKLNVIRAAFLALDQLTEKRYVS